MRKKKEKLNKQLPISQTNRAEESRLDESAPGYALCELRAHAEKKIQKGNSKWH